MKYYSEETVRNIINGVAHTALEQSENYADVILQNHQSIEISEPHGRLADADKMLSMLERSCGTDSLADTIAREILKGLIKNAPTVLEATEERQNNGRVSD